MRSSLFSAVTAAVAAIMSGYTMVVADKVVLTPSNITQFTDMSGAGPIELLIPESAADMEEFASVQPMFPDAVSKLRAWGRDAPLLHLTTANIGNLTDQWIAYVSCDTDMYPGNLGPDFVMDSALAANVNAILLYSVEADYCNISQIDSEYPFIYSMTSANASEVLLRMVDTAPPEAPLHARISFADQVNQANSSNGNGTLSPPGTNNNSSTSNGSPTTAVAMIILYSITGIITALFLSVIITGAVRAHRHPERYGPRTVAGRVRQSRAKGLARAMLDTIPIVKFEDNREAPKPTDVELGDGIHAAPEIIGADHANVIDGDKSAGQNLHTEVAAVRRPSTASAHSGIAPATNELAPAATESSVIDEAPGCSICTEDFSTGEDLRVLPCDHKFHPACIDPWLLNVSGTCPLCRIDLNPQRDASAGEGEDASGLPPPIEGEETTNTSRPRIGMRQSFLIGLGLGRVHDTTREERIEAVRRIRAQQAHYRQQRMLAVEADLAEERSRRQRFRDRFGIRTRRGGQESEAAGDAAAAATPPTPSADSTTATTNEQDRAT